MTPKQQHCIFKHCFKMNVTDFKISLEIGLLDILLVESKNIEKRSIATEKI